MIARVFVIGCVMAVLASCACSAAEVRGAWLGAWWPGYFTASEIDASIAAAKKAGVNALFIQVRKNADAYYNSKIEAHASNIAADFDPLAYTIEKAHAQGIQVHAWVNAFRVASTAPPTDPKHITHVHPDWINKSFDGQTRGGEGVYLDPGVPAASDYVAKIMLDIATRYKLDGIQWDYIRYPGVNWGYADAALARYYAETGATTKPDPSDPKWLQWKRDQVTKLVRSVYKQIHAVKPKIVISASTVTWGNCPTDFTKGDAYQTVCQDWKAWMEEGILDANLPMAYKVESTPKGAQSFRGWLEGFAKWDGGRATYVGIDVDNNDDAAVLAQIEAVRKAGLEGYVLYKFNESQRRDTLVAAMAGGAKSAPQPPAGATPPAPVVNPKP